MNIVKGDIVYANVDMIVQQCNCITRNSCGLANYISTKLNVDIYSTRRAMNGCINLSVPEDRGIPGTCVIVKNESNIAPCKYVACLLAQFAPGKPMKYYKNIARDHKLKDNEEDRLLWFQQSLVHLKEHIIKLNIKSIAFPKMIGCGLAGGDEKLYWNMLESFSNNMKELNVIIYFYVA